MLGELVDCVLEQLFRELGKEGSVGVDIKIISSRLLSSPFSLSLSLSLSLNPTRCPTAAVMVVVASRRE
jgi:hypothetical protein